MRQKKLAGICAVLLGILISAPATGAPVSIRSDQLTVRIDPESLAAELSLPEDSRPIPISHAQPQPTTGSVRLLETQPASIIWHDDSRGVDVSVRIEESSVVFEFRAGKPGEIRWPVIKSPEPSAEFLLPIGMGHCIPADHAVWLAHLAGRSPTAMTEEFSMPFAGLLSDGRTLTWIFENEFHNSIEYIAKGGLLQLSVTHRFTRLAAGIPYTVRVMAGKADPVEPARNYRAWRARQGGLVTLEDKITSNSEVGRLAGAAHIYIWGADPLTVTDVKDWKGLREDLRQAQANPAHPARSLLDAMNAEECASVKTFLAAEWPSKYDKAQVIAALNRQISVTGMRLLPEGTEALRIRKGCREVAGRFPGRFPPVEDWGGILSSASINKIRKAGIDRLWIGLDSWRMGLAHPEGVRAAREVGFLIGPYDSYHSIHRPGQSNTWETAQFDADLYERGAIINAEGKVLTGFKKMGRLLSPVSARPYVRRRISALMAQTPFNSWFFDCDAFGEVFDNFSREFPHTQQEDAAARLERMQWAAREYRLVVGSEGGASYASPVIAFAHGLLTPGIAWGDEDLYRNKESKYYLGRYYPPDGPEVFFKQVPLKPGYSTFYFDPKFRIPLYPVALGDSVVATHQWGFPSRKFTDQWRTVRLTELLYGAPPLEHVNQETLDTWLADFVPYYRVFSPLLRKTALRPMTEFRWLNEGRTVHQSVFGNAARITVNFSDTPWQNLPPQSARIEYLDEGKQDIYSAAH